MATVVKKKVVWANTRNLDWDKWSDGRIWKCVKGIDFGISCHNFRVACYRNAASRDMKAQTKIEGKAVIFQFLNR